MAKHRLPFNKHITPLSSGEGSGVRLLFIAKETKHIVRDKRTLLILLGMPLVMMLLFGFAIRTDVKDVRTVLVTASHDAATQRVAHEIDASSYFSVVQSVPTAEAAKHLMRQQKADIALVFSPHYGRHLADGTARLQLVTDATDPNMAQQYVAYAQQVIAHTAASPVNIKYLYNPEMESSYNFVPGIMGMLLLLVCALMTSISIVREKERGSMEVLLVSPVRPLLVIVAKMVPYMVMGFVILTAILLMAYYLLQVPLSGSIALIYLLSMLYILLALSLGLLISTVADTQMTALLFSAMVLLMPCLLLSGMMFPIESMPRVLQWVTYIVPPRYYVEAMRKLMIMGTGFSSIRYDFFVLLAMTIVLMALALKNYKQRLE